MGMMYPRRKAEGIWPVEVIALVSKQTEDSRT